MDSKYSCCLGDRGLIVFLGVLMIWSLKIALGSSSVSAALETMFVRNSLEISSPEWVAAYNSLMTLLALEIWSASPSILIILPFWKIFTLSFFSIIFKLPFNSPTKLASARLSTGSKMSCWEILWDACIKLVVCAPVKKCDPEVSVPKLYQS